MYKDRVGEFISNVELKTCIGAGVTRPRVCSMDENILVEFPRALRERFPIGTRYIATVKVCQKTEKASGKLKGSPYLKAYDIAIIPSSVKDEGLVACVREGSISGLAYEYVWQTKE